MLRSLVLGVQCAGSGATLIGTSPPLYFFPKAREWFEVNRTREVKTLSWIPFPADMTLFLEITDRPDGPAMFGCFVALLLVAARSKLRWHLQDDFRRAHTAESLARIIGMPVKVIEETLRLLIEIGMAETVKQKRPRFNGVASHLPAAIPQVPAARGDREESKKNKKREESGGGSTKITGSGEQPADAPPPKSFPNALACVRERWPEADEGLIQRIACENNCDDDIAIEYAIREAHKRTGHRQKSQGMFLRTLP